MCMIDDGDGHVTMLSEADPVARKWHRCRECGRKIHPRERYHVDRYYVIDRGADGRQLSKATQVRMCGNSVCPPLARAIVAANYSERQAMREAA